jgi:hypothetical protein
MATVFEPIRPVPPITTIFMVYPSLVVKAIQRPKRTSGRLAWMYTEVQPSARI